MAVIQKIKVSFHSGRGYARHNNHYPVKRDKGNINYALTPKNKIWTRIKGVTDVVQAEKIVYEEFFVEELNQQNAKYRKKGKYKNIRTIDEWMKAERHRPVENILQIGDMNCYIKPDDLWDCYVEFTRWRNRQYGDHIILISAVMHVDETTPHIHERYVWYWTDDNGVKHTGVKKSLEQAGVDLPDPDKPEGRYNYRKMTFDAECRQKWQDIVENVLQKYKDVELDRTVNQERKKDKIGHMGVDSWRAYSAAMKKAGKKASMLARQEEDLKQRESEIIEEKKRLEEAAEDLKAAAQQQDADTAAIADKMAWIAAREKELEEQNRTFRQRVEDAARRRVQAEEKMEKARCDLKRYYSDSGYTLGSNS